MGMPKSVEVWNVWKECGIFPQKVVEYYCGMGEWGNGGMAHGVGFAQGCAKLAPCYNSYFLILL